MDDWVFTSGCVCCIFTVAFGSAGLLVPSGGSVIRAVSFFGAAPFCVTGSNAGVGPPDGDGAGFSGTVGRAPSDGGFGGGFAALIGLAAGSATVGSGCGEGGGDVAGALPASVGSFVVSFFGVTPAGGGWGFPGTLMRTVSRFTAGCSLLGGSVMRIVSLFVTSSGFSDGAGGISSAI